MRRSRVKDATCLHRTKLASLLSAHRHQGLLLNSVSNEPRHRIDDLQSAVNTMGSTWRIKMLYDGKCPLCSREVSLLRKRNANGLIEFEDITLPEFDAGKYGLTMGQVVGAMHAIRPDGSVVRGIDVFAEVYDAVGWKWLAWPIRWRVTRPFAKIGYQIFATVRPWLSSFRPAECKDACRQPASRRLISVAFLIFSATLIGGCRTSTLPPAAPFPAIRPTTSQPQPASKQVLPAATEESVMKKPFMIGRSTAPRRVPPAGAGG